MQGTQGLTVRLEDLDQLRFTQYSRSNRQNHVHQFILPEIRFPAVHQQERNSRVRAHSFVAVEERVVLAEMKQVRRAIAGMEVCRYSPPNVAWGVATADSRPAASRSPDDPPYRSICCSWISRTSSSERNTGSTMLPLTYSASLRNALP